jgi:hypothetical protein
MSNGKSLASVTASVFQPRQSRMVKNVESDDDDEDANLNEGQDCRHDKNLTVADEYRGAMTTNSHFRSNKPLKIAPIELIDAS